MANERDIVYRPLYESPIISVHDYCCHIERSGPGAEEESDANNIVLMRHGAFARHFGRRTTTADVNANGALSYDLALVTPLLKPWVGDGIQLVGKETARFQAAGSLTPTQTGAHWSRTLEARGEVRKASEAIKKK